MRTNNSAARHPAEETLARQRELCDRVFENIPVLLVMWDPKLERFTLNRHAESVLGWTAAESNRGDLMAKVYPDPTYRREVAAYMESLDPGWREWICTTKDGERVPIDWANIRLTDDTMIGIGVDLRERKRAEEALRRLNAELEQRVEERTAELGESEARFKAIFEKATDGIILADVHTRMFHSANRAASAMLGYREEELCGMGVADIHPEVELRRIMDAFDRQARGEFSLASDIPLKRRDGKVVYADVNSFPLRVDGKEYLAGIFRDATERRRTEEVLAGSEARYRGLVENTLDVPCSLDAVGKILYVGPQVERYGFEPGDIEGRFFLDLVFSGDRDRLAADFETTLREGRTFPSEFRIQAPDGVVYWFEERSTAHRDTSGTIMGFTGVLRDVTARKAAESREHAVLQRLQSFEAAVNEGPAVVFRWRIVPGEWPVEMVTANVRQFGYEAEDLTSGRVSWPGITHPEDVPILESDVRAFLEQGAPQFHQHYRLITKSGEIRHVEDWNTVITDENGQPTHIQAIVMDVTHHREEEQRRRESEEKYRSLSSNIPGMIYRGRPDWSTDLIVNSEALCGYSPDEFDSGKINWTDIIHPDDRQRVLDQVSTLTAGTTSVVQEYRVLTKDGKVRWVSDHKTLSFRPDGSFSHVDGIAYDITDHKRTEMEIQRSEQRFRALAEQSPNMIFINHGGRVVYANSMCEQVTGYTRAEFYAPEFDFRTIHAPESVPLVQSRFEQQMSGKELSPCEVALLTKDGKRIETILSTRLVDYEGDKAILGILTDITARKRAERLRIQHQKQLRNLGARLATAQDEEQRRIAEGLHDDVAQLLTACSVKMGVAEKAESTVEMRAVHDEIDGLLAEANEKVRSLSFELSSSTLYRLGLGEAVHELCGSMSTRYGVRFLMQGDGPPEGLDDATSTILFKAIRELLFNVVKHADTKEAWVCIEQSDRSLKLTVEDHGEGFPNGWADRNMNAGQGLGLFGIRERLRTLSGRMDIDSTPRVSTRVTLSVPLGQELPTSQQPMT